LQEGSTQTLKFAFRHGASHCRASKGSLSTMIMMIVFPPRDSDRLVVFQVEPTRVIRGAQCSSSSCSHRRRQRCRESSKPGSVSCPLVVSLESRPEPHVAASPARRVMIPTLAHSATVRSYTAARWHFRKFLCAPNSSEPLWSQVPTQDSVRAFRPSRSARMSRASSHRYHLFIELDAAVTDFTSK
jgi:hypothetical protein